MFTLLEAYVMIKAFSEILGISEEQAIRHMKKNIKEEDIRDVVEKVKDDMIEKHYEKYKGMTA